MYWGYLGYGDVEVSNVARLVKYVGEGLAPSDLVLTPNVGVYDDLPGALGDDPYRTPLLDGAPWYDATNPDSGDFAGILVTDVSGVEGSTRTRSVVESIADGGRAGRDRASSRTIGVTAMAIANTDAALEAGIDWLTGVLHPPCAGAVEACGGAALAMFSSAPVYCEETVDFDAAPITSQIVAPGSVFPNPRVALIDVTGGYLPGICAPVTVTAVVARDTVGGSPAPTPLYAITATDSNMSLTAPTTGTLTIGGVPIIAVGAPVLFKNQTTQNQNGLRIYQGPGSHWSRATDMDTWAETVDAYVYIGAGVYSGDYFHSDTTAGGTLGTTAITFSPSAAPAPTVGPPDASTVRMDLADSAGTIYGSTGEVPLPADGSTTTLTITLDPTSPGFPADWQPIIAWGGDPDQYVGDLRVDSWTYTRQPVLTPQECLADLHRTFRNVVTVAGPTVVDELAYDDGTPYAAVVEWTWVATDPVAYGADSNLLRGMLVGRFTAATHPAVRVSSTADVALFRLETELKIDDVVVDPGNRVLLKNQTTGSANGVYTYNGPGNYLTRVTDMDTWGEVVGAAVYVQEGSVGAGTSWHTTAAGGGTLETTTITWASGAGGGSPSLDDGITHQAPGIQVGTNANVTGASTACLFTAPDFVLCGADPDLPPVLVPPLPPTLVDPAMPTVTNYTRRAFQIPPSLSPEPGGVLSLTVRNLGSDDYRGIRVRLWVDVDPDFGVPDECAFDQELYITYLAGDQTVTIDGPGHHVTSTCDSGLDADHEPSMRGSYGGPFAFPDLRCGDRYHVTVDVPVTGSGGGVAVDVTVTRRGV